MEHLRPEVVVLGVAQDGGYPHAGCTGVCCEAAWHDATLRRRVACLGIVDSRSGEVWLLDATPDLPSQLAQVLRPPAVGTLRDLAGSFPETERPLSTGSTPEIEFASPGSGGLEYELRNSAAPSPGSTGSSTKPAPRLAGILLTHAHVGHYLGLAQLGREGMGLRGLPLHVMPRMRAFLERNGPWDQLVRLGNVDLRPLAAGRETALSEHVRIEPIPVPHRGEYTETVGFRVSGTNRSVLYLPDIDSWDAWELDLAEVVRSVDRAYLDGTFFEADELSGPGRSGRRPEEVPHPPVRETMRRLAPEPLEIRQRVRFLHLNHTNPVLRGGTGEVEDVIAAGFAVAREGERFPL